MNEQFNEVLRTLYGVGSLATLGYFLWVLRELTKDLKDLRKEFDQMKGEHDSYKEFHRCPLIQGDAHGNQAHN